MDVTFLKMISHVISNYGSSLTYGHRYIFQSMPRMLTLWLDFGEALLAKHMLKGSSSKEVCHLHNKKLQFIIRLMA